MLAMDKFFIHIILVLFQTRVVDIMGQLLEGMKFIVVHIQGCHQYQYSVYQYFHL